MDDDSNFMAGSKSGNADDQIADGGTLVGVHAGFPNPAADRRGPISDGTGRSSPLSLDKLLIKHPSSTYFFRIRGHNWENQGIFDGDIAVIDRTLNPRGTDTVVWWNESGEFYLTRFTRARRQNIWGVVSATIHPTRKETNHA